MMTYQYRLSWHEDERKTHTKKIKKNVAFFKSTAMRGGKKLREGMCKAEIDVE